MQQCRTYHRQIIEIGGLGQTTGNLEGSSWCEDDRKRTVEYRANIDRIERKLAQWKKSHRFLTSWNSRKNMLALRAESSTRNGAIDAYSWHGTVAYLALGSRSWSMCTCYRF